jgi:NADP-dependent 3-hydroxy acid dehydrogenase YdfG
MAKTMDGQVVWITGGGSGLGREMALEYARRGATVVVSGRRLDRLEEVAEEIRQSGGNAQAAVCDVTDETSIETCVETLVAQHGQLDIAVANAGFSVAGRVEELTADDWRRQFDTNVVGLAITARHALPHLRKTRGRLALIGSVAGTVAFPGVGAYHASKYAVRAIGQVLAMELNGSGVSCTTIQPGFVKSEIAQVDNSGQYHAEWDDKRPQPLMWETDKAARVIVDAIGRREREFTFTAHGKAAAFLGKHAPGFVHLAVTRFGGGYKRR